KARPVKDGQAVGGTRRRSDARSPSGRNAAGRGLPRPCPAAARAAGARAASTLPTGARAASALAAAARAASALAPRAAAGPPGAPGVLASGAPSALRGAASAPGGRFIGGTSKQRSAGEDQSQTKHREGGHHGWGAARDRGRWALNARPSPT